MAVELEDMKLWLKQDGDEDDTLIESLITTATEYVEDIIGTTYDDSGGDDMPEGVKTIVKLLVSHWYENRMAVVTGTIATELPLAVNALLWQQRYK